MRIISINGVQTWCLVVIWDVEIYIFVLGKSMIKCGLWFKWILQVIWVIVNGIVSSSVWVTYVCIEMVWFLLSGMVIFIKFNSYSLLMVFIVFNLVISILLLISLVWGVWYLLLLIVLFKIGVFISWVVLVIFNSLSILLFMFDIYSNLLIFNLIC